MMPSAEATQRLLERLEPVSEPEQTYRLQMLELCQTAAPFARHQFEPGHFTASAFILSPDRSALLLIYHAKLERWLQPGGHVEAGDPSLVEAAYREAMEECALERHELELLGDAPFDIDVHEIPARRDEPAHLHYDVRYLFRCTTTAAQAGDGVLDLAYVSLDRINERASDASVLRAVRRLQTLGVPSHERRT